MSSKFLKTSSVREDSTESEKQIFGLWSLIRKIKSFLTKTDRRMSQGDDNVSLTMSVNDESVPSADDSLKHISRSISLRSYSKWSPTEHGINLAWRDVSIYAAKSSKKIKRIINNSTGAITSGSLVALMGSSASGKTTLMSSLAYRQSREFRESAAAFGSEKVFLSLL